LRTVVNKVEGIDTKFRFFKMEILAGENNTHAEVVSDPTPGLVLPLLLPFHKLAVSLDC